MEKSINRMKELTVLLTKAAKAYYHDDKEIMSNLEYDERYDELLALEKETGIVFSSSPTQKVGYEVLGELLNEAHETSMLSLDKTKSLEELKDWLGEHKGVLSWKLDGLTIVLTYNQGMLKKAVTRGNGEVGEVITNNARVFSNIPSQIPYKGKLIIRGEAVITYSQFQKINEEIEGVEAKYKNPRNLCSGTVRQLNNEITARRNVKFEAFGVVNVQQLDFKDSRQQQMIWLKEQGFDVVPYKVVTKETIEQAVEEFAERVVDYDIPSDGLVLTFDEIDYGESLGSTSKFPRHSIAFKWVDEKKETILKEIQWSPSRTGLINPVAIFEPVELEGTTVARASVHNISILKALKLGEGDTITVYKANMIIPQIAENLTQSDTVQIPCVCRVCGGQTQIKQVNDVQSLYCINPECQAKKIKGFALFVSRDALNIDGLSEATLEKFITEGFIKEYADIFHLESHQEAITQMEGFGQKSYDNLIQAIKIASNTTLPRVIYGLGIAGIGLANAKMLSKKFRFHFDKMRNATLEELIEVDGIGAVLAQAWVDYFADESNQQMLHRLLSELTIIEEEQNSSSQVLEGKVFVITGSLNYYENRKQLQEAIEELGGKVTGSVTSRTSYLINNDTKSNSSKNKKAKELEIPILSEQDFLERFKES